jgi:hypothetical protein
MPSGVSDPYYPIQPDPVYPFELDNGYFLIKLRSAQAFFPAGLLTQVDSLLLSSSVESTFMSGPAAQSLHKLTMIRKNTPSHLGVNTNLTDWLPARATDTVKITLNYTVTRGAPIKALVDRIEQLDLAAKVSVVRPDVAVAVKVTQIVANLLSSLLQEGGQTDVFTLAMDLNVADLKSGYYAVIGSRTDEVWPNMLQVDGNGRLTDRWGHDLSRHSYVVIQVLTLKRRGSEVLRDETWGELLQVGKDQALSAAFGTEEERSKALQNWRANLTQVRMLARKDRAFLQKEVDGIIADAQLEVEQKLLSRTAQEATGLDDLYPDEWQEVLGVSNPQDLRRTVRDYQDALKLSESLMQQYMILER